MSQLLENPKIVRTIAQNLSIVDRLNFSQYSDNVTKFLKIDDLEYFKERLELVLITYDSTYLPDLLVDTEYTDPFKVHKTNDPKSTVITILNPLRPYLNKLRLLKIDEIDQFDFNKFFESDTMSSHEKAKHLKDLAKFIKMDNVDIDNYNEMSEKVLLLISKYTKDKFDELIDNFNRKEYSIVNLLVETLNILDEEDRLVEFFEQENKFPEDFFPETILDAADSLQMDSLNDVINDLTEYINKKSEIIDKCFGDQLPVMLMFIEQIIQKNVYEYFVKESDKCIDIVPHVYYKLLNVFVVNLVESENAGKTFKEMVTTFINLYFEPLIEKFLTEDLSNFQSEAINEIETFTNETIEQEKLEKDHIYKSILTEYDSAGDAKTNKFELLTSFTKIFNKSNKESNEIKFRVNFEVINKNLQNLKSFINFELCYQIIEKAKSKVEITSIFSKVNNTIIDKKRVNTQIEDIFITLVSIISQYHLKPGFEKAIEFLNKYDPNEFKSLDSIDNMSAVEPLVKFTELINVGDLIQQMIEIFYENELVSKRIVDKNEFLNNANQSKKQFETVLDNFVANGLNIGIDKLMDEIEFLFNTLQLPNDFNPNETEDVLRMTGPTKCAQKVVALLSVHINLLNGSTETSIIDIFQQEIGERFFRIIVKNIKKRQISTAGSIILISDLNLYYDFIVNTLKQKTITPYFVGLKEIGQLYLISTNDSKELGKLIGDLSKFNGIFKQEEIYEFVQKRSDWLKIKKHVEKAMYGLGLTDCSIM